MSLKNLNKYKHYLKSFLIITLVTTLGFCIVYRKWSAESWQYPIAYQADHMAVHFYTRMYGIGEFKPFFNKTTSLMNAPGGADLSDLPNNEDILYFSISLFQKLFDHFPGSNLATLFYLILNGLSFYLFLNYYGINNRLATAGGTLVSLSHFMLLRGFEHIMLMAAWHIPFLFIICDWCFRDDEVWTKKRVTFGAMTSLYAGLSFPYYTFIYFHFLFFGFIRQIIKKIYRKCYFAIFMVMVSAFGTLLGHLDTITYRIKNGPNLLILTRDLSSIEQYGMKIADLFLPYTHILKGIQNWTHKIYYDQSFLIHTEPGYSYLGLIGSVAVLYSLSQPILHLFKEKRQELDHYWLYLYWTIIFSLSGGINFLLSNLSGVYLFRCTNRYSIIVLMIALLLFFRRFNYIMNKWVICGIMLIALVDLPARMGKNQYLEIKERVDSDREFVTQMEKIMPDGAMVFQLPVIDYPEYPKVNDMTDYDHFRPAFYTAKYKWSYASVKGRPDNDWQKELQAKPIAELVDGLRQKHFSAIYINKRAFIDGGKKIIEELQKNVPNGAEVASRELYLKMLN